MRVGRSRNSEQRGRGKVSIIESSKICTPSVTRRSDRAPRSARRQVLLPAAVHLLVAVPCAWYVLGVLSGLLWWLWGGGLASTAWQARGREWHFCHASCCVKLACCHGLLASPCRIVGAVTLSLLAVCAPAPSQRPRALCPCLQRRGAAAFVWGPCRTVLTSVCAAASAGPPASRPHL